MQNLTAIPIIPTKNDFPEILEDGPNGALITQKINQLVDKSFRPFNTLDDNTAPYERYLDTVNGSDDNNGLTANTAYKTWDRAIQDFKVGMISWNWNAFLYVKGELQAPLDLRGIYATSNDWRTEGALTLDKFPDEPDNYTITSVDDPDGYRSKQVFIADGNFITLAFINCTLNVTSQMVFVDNTIYFTPSVTIKPTATANNRSIVIGRGTYYLQGLTHDYSDKVFQIEFGGIGCAASIENTHSFINNQQNNDFIHILNNADVRFQAVLDSDGFTKSINCQSGKLTCNTNVSNLIVSVDEKSDFSWHDWTKFNFCITLTFPILTNGRYKVWTPQRRCRLLEWKLSANSGNGTFQADIGNPDTLKIGAVLTQNFTNAYEEITRSMNVDVPYAGAFPFFLSVTDSTVPLTNVLLQLNYRSY